MPACYAAHMPTRMMAMARLRCSSTCSAGVWGPGWDTQTARQHSAHEATLASQVSGLVLRPVLVAVPRHLPAPPRQQPPRCPPRPPVMTWRPYTTLAVEGIMMPMQARKSKLEAILFARVLQGVTMVKGRV